MLKRKPDVVIGPPDNPYMERWHLIPRNKWFSVYLHKISRSDDDRALHDHRADNLSIILKGSYIEHTYAFWDSPRLFANGYTSQTYDFIKAGMVRFRKAETPHRLELPIDASGKEVPVWTLWIKFKERREWGFWPDNVWMHWQSYLRKYDSMESNYK